MPACSGGLLTRLKNILWRIEDSCGTAETLAAADGISRLTVDSTAEYNAPREDRDLAQATLSRQGTLESTKAININVNSELNTPDTLVQTGLEAEVVSAINWQSGNLVRYSFSGTPTLSPVSIGDYLFCNSADEAVNNGAFPITAFSDVNDTIDVINRGVEDDTYDETTNGLCDVLNPIEYAPAIEACSQDINVVRKITIGTLTGNLARNDTITGGTSSATGRVVVPMTAGAGGTLYYQLLTGIFQTGEVITGALAGSATSSSAPSTAGYSVVPKSSNQEAVTVRLEDDGYQWTARSAMGEMSISFESSKKAMISFALQGPKSSTGDQTLTTVTRYSEQPPILKNASLLIGSTSPVFGGMTFAQNNEITLRPNANATGDSGFETARITGRRPTLTINMEWLLASEFDIITGYDAGTDYAISFNVGTVAGKSVYFYADEAEISAPPLGDNDGVLSVDLEFLLKGTGNNVDREYEILFL